jgi:hypothetical protein
MVMGEIVSPLFAIFATRKVADGRAVNTEGEALLRY